MMIILHIKQAQNRLDVIDINNEAMIAICHLINQVKLLESMISNLSCGNVTDNEEKERDWINKMWSLSVGIVEYTKWIERMMSDEK